MLLDTPGVDFGRPAPEFELKTPEGAMHSRDSLMGPNGLSVAFICNHCPYVIAVIDRLAEDFRSLAALGVGGACIMSNDWDSYPADSPERMVDFARAHGLEVPYLVDADQSVARGFGAVCTPDFFGYDAMGGLQYRGRLDDALRGDASGRVPEMLNAMSAVARGEGGPVDQVASMGCSIKWR